MKWKKIEGNNVLIEKKEKDQRKNRIIPDQYRKPGKRTKDLLTR